MTLDGGMRQLPQEFVDTTKFQQKEVENKAEIKSTFSTELKGISEDQELAVLDLVKQVKEHNTKLNTDTQDVNQTTLAFKEEHTVVIDKTKSDSPTTIFDKTIGGKEEEESPVSTGKPSEKTSKLLKLKAKTDTTTEIKTEEKKVEAPKVETIKQAKVQNKKIDIVATFTKKEKENKVWMEAKPVVLEMLLDNEASQKTGKAVYKKGLPSVTESFKNLYNEDKGDAKVDKLINFFGTDKGSYTEHSFKVIKLMHQVSSNIKKNDLNTINNNLDTEFLNIKDIVLGNDEKGIQGSNFYGPERESMEKNLDVTKKVIKEIISGKKSNDPNVEEGLKKLEKDEDFLNKENALAEETIIRDKLKTQKEELTEKLTPMNNAIKKAQTELDNMKTPQKTKEFHPNKVKQKETEISSLDKELMEHGKVLRECGNKFLASENKINELKKDLVVKTVDIMNIGILTKIAGAGAFAMLGGQDIGNLAMAVGWDLNDLK